MATLSYVPLEEVQRIHSLSLPVTERTALFADVCRINTLYAIARAGSGHIGTSFSSIDIVSWLFLNELRLPRGYDKSQPVDRYFSSKGHDVPAFYSVLIGLGLLPFDLLHQLRRKDGLPGHPDVGTPYIEANTGSLGMGISKAKGMALANRLQGQEGQIYVLTGDGELQEGQFWESLVSAANRPFGEITVIIDHNKLQSDTYVSRTSDLGDLAAKLHSFGWHVERCNGHNMEELAEVFERLRPIADRPKIIIADTVKGRGVSFMEHTALKPEDKLYRFHSGAPDDPTYERGAAELIGRVNGKLREAGVPELRLETAERPPRPAPANPQRLVAAYGKALVCQAEANDRIVAYDADLVLDTGLIPFQERFPERFVECGIAEQDMVSQASGAALRGLLPVVHSFACFLSDRPNEQIYNNATERTQVVYVGSLAGLLPGGPGHSHQCVRDISALAGIPGLVLLEPCTEGEVAQAVDFCLNRTKESSYLRLVSIPVEVPFELPADYRLEPGRGVALAEGTDAVVFGYGPWLLGEAYKAASLLRERQGISVRVVNLPWLNRVDREWLRSALSGVSQVFTLDNHYVYGGQGDMLLRELAEMGLAGAVRAQRLGVTQIPVCGTNDEVMRAHGLDAESLAATLSAAIRAGG
jgi:transketolase